MRTPSTRRLIEVAAGFCVSFWATFTLLSFIRYTPGVTNRVGLLCAFVCTFGLLVFFWAAGSAFVIHKMGWTYRACRYVGFVFLLPGSVLFWSHVGALSIANFLLFQVAMSSYICKRIAFPEISDEQAAALEPPLTMFPK